MRKPFNGDFRLTQPFGNAHLGNTNPYAQFGMAGHNGLDYGLPTGTEVLAAISGTVKEVADEGKTGYGKYIKIENDNEGSLVAHLKEQKVSVGQQVSEGQVIGISNNTGNSTGPHLHWGYYKFPRDRQNGYAGYIDQLPLISDSGSSTYKGYDLTNKDSMKVAVDVLVRVQNGEFIDKPQYDKDIQELQKKLTECQNKPPQATDPDAAKNKKKADLFNQIVNDLSASGKLSSNDPDVYLDKTTVPEVINRVIGDSNVLKDSNSKLKAFIDRTKAIVYNKWTFYPGQNYWVKRLQELKTEFQKGI